MKVKSEELRKAKVVPEKTATSLPCLRIRRLAICRVNTAMWKLSTFKFKGFNLDQSKWEKFSRSFTPKGFQNSLTTRITSS